MTVLATGASAGHLPTGPALATRSSPTRTSLPPSGHALTVAGSLLLGLTVLGAGAEELVGPPPGPEGARQQRHPGSAHDDATSVPGPTRLLVRAFLAAADVEGTAPMVAAF